ncbi:TetR/AcrR family transcriptional regulator [Spirillospora sp. NBC_00431]
MKKISAPRSAVRSRTFHAILEAAAATLARDRAATLAEIAKAAGVGYSTLNRYFPDRASLLDAAIEDSWRVIGRAVNDTELDHGPPVDAMRRLVSAMVDAGDRLLFLYGDSSILEETAEAPDPATGPITLLVERGQREGVFDPAVSADWIVSTLWALVYSGCEAARRGVLPRQGIAPTVIRTLEHGIRGE